MPTTYNGNLTGITARQNVQISKPADGDPMNAASIAPSLESLSNLIQYLMQKAGLLDQASTWTGVQTFNVAPVWAVFQEFINGVKGSINNASTPAVDGVNAGAGPGGRFTSAGQKAAVIPAAKDWGYEAVVTRSVVMMANAFVGSSGIYDATNTWDKWKSRAAGASELGARIPLPKNAKILSASIFLNNTALPTLNVDVAIRHLTYNSSGSEITGPYTESLVVASQTIASLGNGGLWYPITISGSANRVTDAATYAFITLPSSPSDGILEFGGLRLTYEHDLITPAG